MKKFLTLALAALMLCSALAGCAALPTATGAISENIRVTSSDGEIAAAWLTDRLGNKLTDRVVLGTDADGYGVSLGALEECGYVIRALGGEIALFARTADGLDRAVREYAKAVENGVPVGDETFGEGHRIKRLTVAGADISTFAIRAEGPDSDADVSGLRFRIETVVVPAFTELLEMTCGASLSENEDAEHFVIFRPSPDPDFTEGDFRYSVENGDLVFEYCELLGAKNAVVTFFEDECGWQALDAGRDFLPESEHIDVAADCDVKVDVMLDGLMLPTRAFGTQLRNSAFRNCAGYRPLYYTDYRIHHACNGWLTYKWGGFDVGNSTPCMTNDATIDLVVDSITEYADDRVASGAVIGYDLNYIDVAHGDTAIFCECQRCSRVYSAEGSRSGASVRFANAIAEQLEEAGYSPLKVITYAYRGNYAPCKTRPRDDVYVTFCIHGRCINHPVDARRCTEVTHPLDHVGPEHFARWMKGWGELTDNLYLWDYFLDYNLHPYIIVDQIWEDMHYMRDCRVTRSYWECHQCGIGTIELHCQLAKWLNRHPDATRAEYDAKYRELLELHYGDSWDKVWEAFDLWEEAESAFNGCSVGWLFADPGDPKQMDYAYYLNECHEKILTLLSGALDGAVCAGDERELELLYAAHLYLACYGGFFYVTETNDEEYLAVLEEKYAEMLAILDRYDVTVESLGGEGAGFTLFDDILTMGRSYWDYTSFYIGKGAREIVVKQFTDYGGDGALRIGAR